MRDDNAINPMHLKREYRASNNSIKERSNHFCEARHLPCTINRVTQRLHQSEGDGNCFYWSIMIAMKLMPNGLSADSIELYESEAAKRQIQDMRTKMLAWWRDRPLKEKYNLGRRWMTTPLSYCKRYARQTARKIAHAGNNGEHEYTTSIIEKLKLSPSPETQQKITKHLIHLYLVELLRALRNEGHDDYWEYPFSAQCYYRLHKWSIDMKSTTIFTNEIDTLLQTEKGINTLKYRFARLVLSELKKGFKKLDLYDGVAAFDEAEFNKMGEMDAGALNEEFIGAAAIFDTVIIKLHIDSSTLIEDKQDHTCTTETRVALYGTIKERPDEVICTTWTEAKQILQNKKAILIAATEGHVEPVCRSHDPHYLLNKQREDIRESGYRLRSIFNDNRNIPRLGYALVLAFGQMQPGFRYCCEESTFEDVKRPYKKLIKKSIKWWKQRKSQKLVRMHKQFELRFVHDIDKDVPPDDVNVMLTDELQLDMHELTNLKFEEWETAVALANKMKKRIFVVRGRGSVVGYGGPAVRARAKWDEVVTALRDKSGVCCFTAATSNDDSFDITHVAVPLSSVKDETGDNNGSHDAPKPYRGEAAANKCQNNSNVGVAYDIDLTHITIDMQGCTHVTLDEAEYLMEFLNSTACKELAASNKSKE